METKALSTIIETEIDRTARILTATRPESGDYRNVLEALRQLIWLHTDLTLPKPQICDANVIENIQPIGSASISSKPNTDVVVTARNETSDEATVSFRSESVGEPEPEPVAEPVKKKKKLTKEDVRAILQAKSESGVLIQPIISQFVPEGKKVALSSIKASDYEALVEAVNNAG